MKIDGTQVLKDYEGKPILVDRERDKDGKRGKRKKLTLRDVISTAINANPAPPAKPMAAETKNKAYQLSVKIWSKKEVDLTVDQLAFVKERVGDVYTPLVYGRVCDILEGKGKKTKAK